MFSGGVGLHAGGGAAITAGHLSALGHGAALAAHFPTGALGDLVDQELQLANVDLRLCGPATARCDPQITVALVHGGERAFVTHRAGAAFPMFTTDEIVEMEIGHVHIGEARTLIENPELVGIAKDADASLSLDCSWDDHIGAEDVARFLPDVDVFLPNTAEFEQLKSLGVDEPLSSLTVIKQGCNGATAISNGSEIHAPAVSANVLDTTGAGDAFNAAFLSAWLEGRSIKDCLEFGNARGAMVVSHRGGLGGN